MDGNRMDSNRETEFLLSVQRIDSRTETIERDIGEIKTTLKDDYTKKVEFNAIKERVERTEKLIAGVGTFIVLSVIGGLIKLLFFMGGAKNVATGS